MIEMVVEEEWVTNISFSPLDSNKDINIRTGTTARPILPLLHQVRYNAHTKSQPWTPSTSNLAKMNYEELLRRQKFVNQTIVGTTRTTTKHRRRPGLELLGFLRIPKTGSTSLLSWAVNASHQGPHYQCFFGPRNKIIKSSPQLLFHQQQNYLYCPHRVYEKTVDFWANEVLPKLVGNRTRTRTFGLRLFTIIRDPFDRLVSYFYYARRIYPHWSSSSTSRQNEAILANDIERWMELLATEESPSFHLPYQRGALIETTNWDLATSWILQEGDTPAPRVLVVIQECFEASLLLLTETFPDYFDTEATKAHLTAEQRQRHNAKNQSQQVETSSLATLRERAKGWFANDFDFYQTATVQFRNRLITSNVDPAIADDCLQKIGS
jgi:hypothetical protein